MSDVKAYRASILHCLADPGNSAAPDNVEYFEDGLLVISDGLVSEVGSAETLLTSLSTQIEITDYTGKLIIPGMVDCHVHYPQTDIIASYGEQLLDWLTRYAYPAEQKFVNAEYASEVASVFSDELLGNGTTTALVFSTVHPQSVEAMFKEAKKRNMRLLTGKVLMDRNCPESLADTAESAYNDSRTLIEKWHGEGRLGYAITPRFAVTSSELQLEAMGKLAAEFPDVHIHTHLAENKAECEFVAEQFPWSRSYLDVYKHFGLVRERSVFAHCLHLDSEDRQTMAEQNAAIAFCPTSNLFLGSGLFDLQAASDAGIRVGVGTDVGGGTSFNMFRTLSEGYKVLHLQDQSLPPYKAFYLATLGGAKSLYLDDKIGNLQAGKEADFVVIDSAASPTTSRRLSLATDVAEKLFALVMLGDDRAIAATYVMGKLAYAN
jgi:guanine deaminase